MLRDQLQASEGHGGGRLPAEVTSAGTTATTRKQAADKAVLQRRLSNAVSLASMLDSVAESKDQPPTTSADGAESYVGLRDALSVHASAAVASSRKSANTRRTSLARMGLVLRGTPEAGEQK